MLPPRVIAHVMVAGCALGGCSLFFPGVAGGCSGRSCRAYSSRGKPTHNAALQCCGCNHQRGYDYENTEYGDK